MKLSECKYGVLVTYAVDVDNPKLLGKVGMVVGVSENCKTGLPVPLVQWQDDKDYRGSVHHSRLALYQD